MNPEEIQNQQVQEEEENKRKSMSAFLKQNVEQTANKEVKLPRFSEAFEIKPLSARDVTKLRNKATKMTFNAKLGQKTPTVDQEVLTNEMIVASIVYPDLENSDLQASYGTFGSPVDTLQAMLEAGEYAQLGDEIQKISGFDTTIAEDVEEAKK